MMQVTLKEAKRLWKMGFALHWLHPKSKRPIESGWTTGPRKSWDQLIKSYSEGFNIGVRLGSPSKIGEGYLCVIDVDVKSQEERHRAEALKAVKDLVGDLSVPIVVSGRGNGSMHVYCLTAKPFKTFNPAHSDDVVKVLMPSKKPSKKEVATLLPQELKDGWRLATAWEISLYSDGRQVVLPPSIHPDTGKTYKWSRDISSVGDLPMLSFEVPVEESVTEKAESLNGEDDPKFDFKVQTVDLGWLPISDAVLKGIKNGTGVSDRSGYLLVASTALLSAGLSNNEVLNVLTDPNTYIGACAYEHAKTKNRARAAAWVYRYTLRKVSEERNAELVFGKASDVKDAKLTKSEMEEQAKDFTSERHWKQDLERSGKGNSGPPKPTIENLLLILKNDVNEKLVRRNEFAFRDAYIDNTPWGGKKDASLTDDDTAKIKHWLGKNWGFEPNKNVIEDALTVMACQNCFDPVRDWLDELPDWDGVARLDTWLKNHFEAEGDPEYLGQVFRKWMTAMVMRVYRPGAKFDWMPIFEGTQGVGKSSFGRVLVGDQYFLDWLPNLGDKDAALGLQGMWSVEMGELSQFRKNELETIKAFITRTVDKFRPPHGRKLIESPRRCVFFGTTNREKYLGDDSGNRRFKPVKVGKLDFERLREERDQLFSEAKMWFQKTSEMDLELTGAARVFELKIHQEKMVEDESSAMQEAMEDFLEKADDLKDRFNPQKFRILDLFSGWGPLQKWRQDNRNLQFAGKMLKKLGGEKRLINGRSHWKLVGCGGKSSPPPTIENEDFF